MKHGEREQARRVAAYVDWFVIHRRNLEQGMESVTPADREFESLSELVQILSEIELATPGRFQQDLEPQIPRLAAEADMASDRGPVGRFSARVASLARTRSGTAPVRSWVKTATVSLTLLLGIIVFVRAFVNTTALSAKEIVSRSDAALADSVGQRQVLYRRWKVTSTITNPDGREVQPKVRSIHEWMDGADIDRVAGRWYDGDNRLLVAYTTLTTGREHRPYVYFGPGMFDEPNGVLNIEPTRSEFEEAVYRFPTSVQLALRAYLMRQYIYEPVTGERRFNRAIIEAPNDGISQMPRFVVSLGSSKAVHGRPVYQVRIVDPASVTFNWRSQGPPRVQLAAAEIIGYIDQNDYLTVQTTATYISENGRKRITSQELVETRTLDVQDPLCTSRLRMLMGSGHRHDSSLQDAGHRDRVRRRCCGSYRNRIRRTADRGVRFNHHRLV